MELTSENLPILIQTARDIGNAAFSDNKEILKTRKRICKEAKELLRGIQSKGQFETAIKQAVGVAKLLGRHPEFKDDGFIKKLVMLAETPPFVLRNNIMSYEAIALFLDSSNRNVGKQFPG